MTACVVPAQEKEQADALVSAESPPAASRTRGVILAQPCRGSQTCIVVGPLDRKVDLDLRGFESVLWFTLESAFQWPEHLGAYLKRVTVEKVERYDADRTLRVLDSFIFRDPLHMPSIFVTELGAGPSSQLFLPVLDAIVAQIDSHRRTRHFRQQRGFLTQSNLLRNLPGYVRQRMPKRWEGALEGVPAFVCGAGPSLDVSATKLKELAPRGVVFAADSALSCLERHGIPVDFAVAIDPLKNPANCLPTAGRRPDRLLLASGSLPDWQQVVPKERIYFLSGTQITEDWLARNLIRKTAAGVVENCGITAFEIALHLGCSPVCLFGMDHAVDSQDPTRWHHKHLSSGLHEQLPDLSSDQKYPLVPGNFQNEIATPLFRELRVLGARCAGLPAGRVLNVIDRGARLRNTTLVHPGDFSVDDHSESRTTLLAQLAQAESLPEPKCRQLFNSIRRIAVSAQPAIARAREALHRAESAQVATLFEQAFRQNPFNQVMGNFCFRILPYLLARETVDGDQWHKLIAETDELLDVARSLH